MVSTQTSQIPLDFRQNKPLSPIIRNRSAGDKPKGEQKLKFVRYASPPPGVLPRAPISSNAPGVAWKNNFGQPMIPPWQELSSQNHTEMYDCVAADIWSCFTFYDFVNALTQGGHGEKIMKMFPLGSNARSLLSNAGKTLSALWLGRFAGPFFWMTLVVALIGTVIMMKLEKKKIKKNLKQFFESFKVMRENDQRESDYCIAAFCAPAAWTNMIREYWHNALLTAKGITGKHKPDSPMQASEKAKAYEEGLKGMWKQKLVLWDLAEKFKAFAGLQIKQNDDTITKAEEKELGYLLTELNIEYNKLGNSSSHFGNLSGGREAFREKALDASDEIYGNLSLAQQYKSDYLALMQDFAKKGPKQKKAAILFMNHIDEASKMIGLTIAEGDGRAAFGRLIFLAGYGTADEIWEEAVGLYSKIEGSESVSANLPSYREIMDVWAARNVDEARKNLNKYGQRYPNKFIRSSAA